MFDCKKCDKEYDDNMSNSCYCKKCGIEHTEYLSSRLDTLASLRSMLLEAKIIQSKVLINQAIRTFGEKHCYISYSGCKDSMVLPHITEQLYPNILYLFANTTNEYPETLKHIRWIINENHINIIMVFLINTKGEMWNFKRVVKRYAYPIFSKRVSNAIRTYQFARTPQTKQNSIDCIERNFKIYQKYIELDLCQYIRQKKLKYYIAFLTPHPLFAPALDNQSYGSVYGLPAFYLCQKLLCGLH